MTSTTSLPVPMAAREGAILVPLERATRLLWGLAAYQHVWRSAWRPEFGPLDLPADLPAIDARPGQPGYVAELLKLAGDAYVASMAYEDATWSERENTRRSAPVVQAVDDWAAEWTPLSGHPGRFIRIELRPVCGRKATITWSTGTGRPSTFIGGALVAVAGGLAHLPPGVVRMEVAP